MATRKLLTNGNAFKRTDGRWGGTVWYMDESGERKRKSFSGTTKQEVNKKMTAYIEDFNNQIATSIEANKTLKDSMTSWLQIQSIELFATCRYSRGVLFIIDLNTRLKYVEDSKPLSALISSMDFFSFPTSCVMAYLMHRLFLYSIGVIPVCSLKQWWKRETLRFDSVASSSISMCHL